MTAEIAIINKNGVALAADSAVTIGGDRVWQTAHKLFSLSPYNDIGIMIFGNGSFIGYPWETIIKTYRKKVGTYKFETVDECAASFINYISSNIIHNEEDEKDSINYLNYQQIVKINDQLEKVRIDNAKDFKTYVSMQIDELNDFIVSSHDIISNNNFLTYAGFNSIFKQTIFEQIKHVFKRNVTKSILEKFCALCYQSYTRQVPSRYDTGLVITGFGEKEFFPSLCEYKLFGKIDGNIRCWKSNHVNLNVDDTPGIIPFAQIDMFRLFMEGISEDNLIFMRTFLEAALNEQSEVMINKYVKSETDRRLENILQKSSNNDILSKFSGGFDVFRRRAITEPILDVVSSLPKEEMAAMAEALVELTSLRRKVDSDIQSVGGPTDVAIISKGDGFIWLKRKHYFEMSLNSEFMHRKSLYRKDSGNV